MITWMRHHHKTIMFGTVALVVPSFILLYGYGEMSQDAAAKPIATVFEYEVMETDLYQLQNRIRDSYKERDEEVDAAQVRFEAFDALVKRQLRVQTASAMGISTTDEQLAQSIRESYPSFYPNGVLDFNTYRYALASANLTPQRFEEQVRGELTMQKLRQTLSAAIVTSPEEDKETLLRGDDKAHIETLVFRASALTDEVEVDEGGLQTFFKENIEDYRIPEKRSIGYVEFRPQDYYDKVTVPERRVERYFNENQQNYKIGERRALEVVLYSGTAYQDQIVTDDAKLQSFLEENQQRYRTRPEARVKYVVIPFTDLVPASGIAEEDIQAAYEKRIQEFTHEDEVKARHILISAKKDRTLQRPATEEEKAAALQEIEKIKKEIEEGRDFAEAAGEYSEDPGSKIKGGDLGFFAHKQMVEPFSDAAFGAEMGEVVGPVQTTYGYHLILVEEKRDAGTDSLATVRDKIVEGLIAERAPAVVEERFATLPSSIDSVPNLPLTRTSDWFDSSGEVDGVVAADRYRFNSAAVAAEIGQVAKPIVGRQHFYLVEPLEKREPRDKSLDEAREGVERDIKYRESNRLAWEAAVADVTQLASAETTWEAISERSGGVVTTGLFERNAQRLNGINSPNIKALVDQAFEMQLNAITGPVQFMGACGIVKLVGQDEAKLLPLDEVRRQVEADVRQDRMIREAKRDADRTAAQVAENEWSLEKAAEVNNLEIAVTEPFDKNGMIPGISGRKPELIEAAFRLEEGGVSGSIETKQTSYSQTPETEEKVDRYYLIEVTEVAADRLPELEEVREEVEEDYKLLHAAEVAKSLAEEAQAKIVSLLANATPFSATQTLDFESLADEVNAEYEAPVSAITRDVMTISGVGYTPLAARTVLSYVTGQISPAIPIHEWKSGETGRREEGDVSAYVIAQVISRLEAGATASEDTSRAAQFQFAQNMFRSQLAFEAWIEEASQTAFDTGAVEIREDYFEERAQKDQEAEEDEEDEESADATES